MHTLATEEQIHRAVVAHLEARAVPGLVWFHPANGELRRKGVGGRLKALGVRTGVADLILLHTGTAYALELKRKGGRVQASQRDFLHRFAKAGGTTAVAYGVDDAVQALEGWGLLRTGARMKNPR